MTFLAPLALLGVLLLAIPIVVHLFKPRKMRQTPFSSLRWLKQTHQRLSRRVQWHQWLLFLARAGVILLLVLALAKPLIGFMGAAAPTDRIVIIDGGRGMACKPSEGPTSMERATELASRLVQTARPGERTAIVLAGAPPRLISPLVVDGSELTPAVVALKPSLADTSVSATLPLVRSLLPRQTGREVELVFVTDNLDNRWQQGDVQTFLKDLPSKPKVRIIDLGPGALHNAWIANARLFQFGADDDRWIRAEVGSVRDSQTARSVRLTGIAGVADESQALTLKPGQLTRVDFKLPAGVNLRHQVAELRLEPADASASDDLFFLNLDTSWSLRVLVVEPETPGEDGRSVSLHLRAAMEALAAPKNQALDVLRRTSTTVGAGDFAKADVVLLAGIPELSDAALESLENRVRAGVGLGLFLGPRAKTAFYNQKLHRPQQPAEGLFPFTLKSETAGRPGQLTSVRWQHPLLAALNDPVTGDLPSSRYAIYGALEGMPGARDTVLARFDDDVPAIIERPFGAGRVLIFNTTANDEWGDLPRRKSFVPLVDRMLSYLSAGGLKRSFTVGEAVVLPLAEHEPGSEIHVLSPSGVKSVPRVIGAAGRALMHLDDIAEAGAYRVEIGGKRNFVFVANAARTDSSLNPMDNKALEAWWAPVSVEVLTAETAGQSLLRASGSWPIWPALVVIAGLFLLVETVYVHWLCPRANPRAADAVVTERGMIKPVGDPTLASRAP